MANSDPRTILGALTRAAGDDPLLFVYEARKMRSWSVAEFIQRELVDERHAVQVITAVTATQRLSFVRYGSHSAVLILSYAD